MFPVASTGVMDGEIEQVKDWLLVMLTEMFYGSLFYSWPCLRKCLTEVYFILGPQFKVQILLCTGGLRCGVSKPLILPLFKTGSNISPLLLNFAWIIHRPDSGRHLRNWWILYQHLLLDVKTPFLSSLTYGRKSGLSKTMNVVKTPIFCNFPSDVLYVAGKTNIPTSWVLCKWMYKCVFVSGQSGTTIWCSASWIAFPSTFFLFTCFIFFLLRFSSLVGKNWGKERFSWQWHFGEIGI